MVLVIKTVWYRSVDKDGEFKNKPLLLWPIDFGKGAKTVQIKERKVSSTNGVRTTGHPRRKG